MKTSIWLFTGINGEEYLDKNKPTRIGKILLDNNRKMLDFPYHSSYIDPGKPKDSKIELSSYIGYNTLFNKNNEIELEGFEIKLEDCYGWSSGIPIPPGTIEKLIGKKLTWKDEPLKYIGKYENN